MTNIVLYQIPSSEIEFLCQRLNRPYYWNPAYSHLMRWDLCLTATDMAIASNPLSEIADLPGDIILDGLLDDGINSKLCHQIVNAFREQRNQTLYLVGDRFDCPHKLFPFVNIKQWQLPDCAKIANFLKQKNVYCDAVYRAALGLYIGELNNVLQMYADFQGEVLASAISDYKIRKLQGRGITVVPQPDCHAAGMDVLDGILAEITDLLKPEADAAGLQFPRGTILIGPPGTGKSLFAKSAASRLG